MQCLSRARKNSAWCAIALVEAERHGEYHASFHGFRVQALRQGSASGADAVVAVDLCVSLGETVVERSLVVAATGAPGMEPTA